MYCIQVIKPEPFLGLLRRSGRYWLLVLRGRGKDRDLHPFTFYGGVFRNSGVLGCVGVQLKIIPLYQDKCYLYLKLSLIHPLRIWAPPFLFLFLLQETK